MLVTLSQAAGAIMVALFDPALRLRETAKTVIVWLLVSVHVAIFLLYVLALIRRIAAAKLKKLQRAELEDLEDVSTKQAGETLRGKNPLFKPQTTGTPSRGRKSMAAKRASRRYSYSPAQSLPRQGPRKMSFALSVANPVLAALAQQQQATENTESPYDASPYDASYYDAEPASTVYEHGAEAQGYEETLETPNEPQAAQVEEAPVAHDLRGKEMSHRWRLVRQMPKARKKSLKLTASTIVQRAVQVFEHNIKNEVVQPEWTPEPHKVS